MALTWLVTGYVMLDHFGERSVCQPPTQLTLLFVSFHTLFIRSESLSPSHSQGEGNEAPPSGYHVLK